MGWYILGGPNPYKVFFFGGTFALVELAKAGLLRALWRAWPIPLMVGLYLIAGWIAPQIDVELESYGVSAAVGTAYYGVAAGFCLALWSRKEPGAVLLGFISFAFGLVIAANEIIREIGIENIIKLSNNEFERENPESGIIFMGIFRIYNVIIGVIPMTVFALAALPLLLFVGMNLHKLLVIIASIGAIYANIVVATRTTLLAAALTYLCVFIVLYLKRAINMSRFTVILLVWILSGVAFTRALDLGGLFEPLMKRISEVGQDSRFNNWRESAVLLWNNPLGSGKDHPSEVWAHNLFLDSGLTNGLFGMLSMLVLYGFMFYSTLRVMQRTDILRQPVAVVFLSAFLASFFIAVTEPPNSSLISFSYLTCCFYLGNEREAAKSNRTKKLGLSGFCHRSPRGGEVANRST